MKMLLSSSLLAAALASVCYATAPVVISTTSGRYQGVSDGGVISFKGIRFGKPPTGDLRWTAPVAAKSTSNHIQDASTFPPSCVQQFSYARAAMNIRLFNNPENPPKESEDCLFLNIWAPSRRGKKLPVVMWIYGGSLSFGTGSIPGYDGTSIAANQDIIVVSFNYRTNVFGFPGSPDLPLTGNNLGYLDQELAMQWVQSNIAAFGGDPRKVTIMGESAGALSVSTSIIRHAPGKAPFRAGISLSGAQASMSPTPSFDSFNAFASAVGCGTTPGAARLACLKKVPTATVRNYTNSEAGAALFRPTVDNVVTFSDPLQRIRTGKTANVPVLLGHMQDDGTLFTINQTNLDTYIEANYGTTITADQVRKLYPGLTDAQIIPATYRDRVFLWQVSSWRRHESTANLTISSPHLWGAALATAGVSNVYRYSYGAVFPYGQPFDNAGAWHSSEVRVIFGTYNRTTATPTEVTLSKTMQTVIANFVKDPFTSPAPRWGKYDAGKKTSILAKLAYDGKVRLSNVVDAVRGDSLDGPCTLWDQFLDVRI
ncbi:Carboxylic ester hydrolase [Mycena indigotica]|uniref:Carboxylic ester hydrolase n=1 Tax=Mycena indigotica TaxID=2126181 RepID=A0A8H6SY91_9AGAR|nr:Carboxylic ester hydrolase [Mycena indigotica]KAF7306522.1 Carboxylic ester hydrolase [Mycena indigotica]